jgi:hypothetical protein
MTVSKVDQKLIRAQALERVFEKTDRILGGNHVRVQVSELQYEFPAFTDGKTITIVGAQDPVERALEQGFTPETMRVASGLNYHELAHVLFTPRLDSRLVEDVKSHGAFMAFNILEDQSAETLFVSLYEPARHYFSSLVTTYMMEDSSYLALNYPLVSGRLFLPQGLRQTFRDAFHQQDKVDRIDQIVVEYKNLRTPNDDPRMLDLILEFKALLEEDLPKMVGVMVSHELSAGSPDQELREQAAQAPEFVDDDDLEDATPGETSGEAEDDDGNDEVEDGSDAEASGDTSPPSDEELEEKLSKAKSKAEDAIHDEVNERLENLRQEQRNYKPEIERSAPTTRAPHPLEHSIAQRCEDEFRRVEMQHAPGWTHRTKSGRLDPRRYAKALDGYDDVFKKWLPGVHDALDFEVVMLIDRSGSMSGSKMEEASVAVWILKRMFEECDGVTTVMGFDSKNAHAILAQRGERALQGTVPLYTSRGLTYVYDALVEANRILYSSIKPLKLCVVVSDGGFYDDDEVERLLPNFVAPVSFIGIQDDSSLRWKESPNVIHVQVINEPTELIDVVKNLALRLSDERLTRRGNA